MMQSIKIGIDPGVKTGVAFWNIPERRLMSVKTMTIIEAMDFLDNCPYYISEVVIEDARVKWYRPDNRTLQGAGSIKRDCSIWEEFCKSRNITHRFVRPNKRLTKFSTGQFKMITGWQERTSEHARDAAMLVYNQ